MVLKTNGGWRIGGWEHYSKEQGFIGQVAMPLCIGEGGTVIRSLYGEEIDGWFTRMLRYSTKRYPWRDIMQCEEDFLSCMEVEVGRG